MSRDFRLTLSLKITGPSDLTNEEIAWAAVKGIRDHCDITEIQTEFRAQRKRGRKPKAKAAISSGRES
jgi:hypothetical protein